MSSEGTNALRNFVSSLVSTPSQTNDQSNKGQNKRQQTKGPRGSWTKDGLRTFLESGNCIILREVNKPIVRGDFEGGFYVECSNKEEHTGESNSTEAMVWIRNGWPCYKCQHSHCSHIGFAEFARMIGLEYVSGLQIDEDHHHYEEFYEWRTFSDGSRKPVKVIDVNICRWICENYVFFILGDEPYFYENGVYVLDEAGAKMKRLIQSCIVPSLCKDGVIGSIFRMITYQDKRKQYDDLNQYPETWVSFQNGLYDPIENRLHPYLPEYYVINMIPHEYHPEMDAASPVFDRVLEYQLPDLSERMLWLEFCGSCFNRDVSQQKMMIIRGSGGTGKSTQLNVLAHCIGSENIANETLQGLNERFNATALFGKLVNICADISAEDLKQIDNLKKITGADLHGVKHERKGKDPFFFTPFCKLVFSANTIPLNRDERSDAFYRRLLITVMDRKPEKIDKQLQNKLYAETDGILHRYMEALQRVYNQGGYTNSKRSDLEVQELRKTADSVMAFLIDAVEKDVNSKIKFSELYDAYLTYCNREDRRYPVSRKSFISRIKDEGISGVLLHGQNYFNGIQLKDSGFINVTEYERDPFY